MFTFTELTPKQRRQWDIDPARLQRQTPGDKMPTYTPEQAITAIHARLEGEYDNTELRRLAPLSPRIKDDLSRIIEQTMNTYTVTVTQEVIESVVLTVQANNADDASDKAFDLSIDSEDWRFVCVAERYVSSIEEQNDE